MRVSVSLNEIKKWGRYVFVSFVCTLEPNREVYFQNPDVIKAGDMRLGGLMAPVLAGALHISDDEKLPLKSMGLAPRPCVDRKSMMVRRAVLENLPEDFLRRSVARLGKVHYL